MTAKQQALDTGTDSVLRFELPDPVLASGIKAGLDRVEDVLHTVVDSDVEFVRSTALHLVMEALVPAETHADHAPYALAAPGALERALGDAGFSVESDRELPGDWHYHSLDEALRGLLCSGGGTRAIRLAGEQRARSALTDGLEPFTQPDGSYLMHNHFRLLVAVTGGAAR